jgi:hypothetical protein
MHGCCWWAERSNGLIQCREQQIHLSEHLNMAVQALEKLCPCCRGLQQKQRLACLEGMGGF